MINYCIQVIVFQALFLCVYDAFLSKETFFSKNRWYLLSTSVLSFVIPLIKIPLAQESLTNELNTILPEIVLSPQSMIESSAVVQYFNQGMIIFWIGSMIAALVFSYRLQILIRLIFKNIKERKAGYTVVILPNSKKAFSFFNYVFLGSHIKGQERSKILEHELVHCKQMHSLDLLLFESFKIVMWFNPLVYLYQKRIAAVHEYISDATVLETTEKKQYLNSMINQLFDVEKVVFVNQFYQTSLIKKRIKMITKEKSKQFKEFKYLLIIPVFLSMVLYVSCTNQDDQKLNVQNDISTDAAKSTTDQLKEETEVQSLDELVLKTENEERVSFISVDNIPTFPECEKNDRNCVNRKIQMHFAQNFDSDLPSKLNLTPGKKRIIMIFTINKEGLIDDVKVKAPHPALKDEVRRILSKLPKMEPGNHKGMPVKVKYTLPIRIDVK